MEQFKRHANHCTTGAMEWRPCMHRLGLNRQILARKCNSDASDRWARVIYPDGATHLWQPNELRAPGRAVKGVPGRGRIQWILFHGDKERPCGHFLSAHRTKQEKGPFSVMHARNACTWLRGCAPLIPVEVFGFFFRDSL